jgi:thiosulfate dehydrogenase [quinone] large subunit
MNATSAGLDARRVHLPAGRGRAAGAVVVLVLRYLFGLFFTVGAVNKFQRDYLFSDYLKNLFTGQLKVLEPGTVPYAFLENFGIPFYQPIGWIVAWGETAVAVGLLLGLATRWSAVLAIFLMVMFGIGGYYDASLLVLSAIAALFVVFPTGHWLGMDRKLHQRHPTSPWFR